MIAVNFHNPTQDSIYSAESILSLWLFREQDVHLCWENIFKNPNYKMRLLKWSSV